MFCGILKSVRKRVRTDLRVLNRLAPILLALALVCCDNSGGKLGAHKTEPVTIAFSCLNDWQAPSKLGPEVIAEFTRETGIIVKTLPFGEELAQRRAQHQVWLERHFEHAGRLRERHH